MKKFNQFTYWKRGVNLGKKKLKVKPKDGKEHLIYYQIRNGDWDESPYWKMANENSQKFDLEKREWKERNPRVSKQSYEDWEMVRRNKWNKEIFKLKEAHQEYELKTINNLIQELNHAFGFVNCPINLEMFEGTLEDLYWAYKKEIQKLIPI